jgi:hypothetical protein
MIDSVRDKCTQCNKRPSYGFPGMDVIVCADHKQNGMENLVSRRCSSPNCPVLNPCFNLPGLKRGIYCSSHKTAEMVDVQHPTCEEKSCSSQPAYDLPGGKGRFCAKHRLPGMIDIKNPFCEYAGCTVVNPCFNLPGSKKGRFCVDHKNPGMVDVKHNVCEESGCTTRPTYNYKGEMTSRFCAAHRKDNMIDISHNFCEQDGCTTRPSYGVKGEKGRFCVKHKMPDMVDVANNICNMAGCITRARYNRPGLSAARCTSHREKGMIAFPTARCKDCKQTAKWGKDMKLLHCEDHKQEDEKNMVDQSCQSCHLMGLIDENGLCETCKPESFIRAALSKQNALMAYLDHRGLYGSTTDKQIDRGACGKERPDRLFDLGDKIVIIECDEHQHKDRVCLCEQTRMINIGQSMGGVPVYFIRFNPDDYNSVAPPVSLSNRYELCGDLIQNIMDQSVSVPYALVSCIYLYFDGWNGFEHEEWNILSSL